MHKTKTEKSTDLNFLFGNLKDVEKQTEKIMKEIDEDQ